MASSSKTVVLVTGANSGIGYETVLALATSSSNYHIYLGSRSLSKGETALSTLQKTHSTSLKSSISVLELDITNEASITAAKTLIEKEFNKLDILINNAGIIVYQEPSLLPALRQTLDTNLYGQIALTEALEPLLRRAVTAPYLIYVSSEQGSITQRLNPEYAHVHIRGDHYRISKAALNMYVACVRHNYADWGCRVVAFNPGWCVTNLTGEEGRKVRTEMGARDPAEPARAIVEIVEGRREGDVAGNGMADVDGGMVPW